MSKSTVKKTKTMKPETPKPLDTGIEASIESATAYSQENVDAIVTSSKVAAKAVESLSAEISAYSKKSYEDGLAAAKELTASKSVSDFVEKQTEFGKSWTKVRLKSGMPTCGLPTRSAFKTENGTPIG